MVELARFERGWSVRFERVAASSAVTFGAQNEQRELAARIDGLLEAARVALGALRSEEAQTALLEVDRTLRAHPELPQSAWWMAEYHQLSRELCPARDVACAEQHRIAALALEGQRAETFGERTTPAAVPAEPARATITVLGIAPRDTVEWDGAMQPASWGEHHLRVLRGERLLWSGWVTLGADAKELRLSVPAITPCGAEDLDATRTDAARPLPAPDTRCSNYAVARVARGKLEMARCQRSRCEAFQPVPAPPATPASPLSVARASGLPPWAWYVAGSVALASGVLLLQSSAGSGDPARDRFRYEGLR